MRAPWVKGDSCGAAGIIDHAVQAGVHPVDLSEEHVPDWWQTPAEPGTVFATLTTEECNLRRLLREAGVKASSRGSI